MSKEMYLQISRIAWVAAWSLSAAIVILSLVPASLRPETSIPHQFEHLLIFAAAGAAFGLAYETMLPLLVLRLASFAAAVEIAQLFVPGRHGRLSDFVVDAASICAAAVAGSLVRRAICVFE
jgi:VanZ family protein